MPLRDTLEELEHRCLKIDALASKVVRRGNSFWHPERAAWRTKAQLHRTFRNMRRKLAKERARLRGWVASAHYDLANHLFSWHELVICPKLKVAEMVPRHGRVFGNASARKMLTFSHGLFAQRLESAAFRWPGRHVRTDTGEPGTSRTCTCCGRWFAGLGGNKEFHCPHCGVRYHRDIGGARNNFFAAYGQAVGVGWDGQTN
jgi:transposase